MVEEWWGSELNEDCVWLTNTLSIGVCIRVARGCKSGGKDYMINLVLVKKDMLSYVQDVKGMG